LLAAGSSLELQEGQYGIILGQRLAAEMQASIGDRIVMLVSQGAITPAGIVPRMRRFEVTGFFESGMYEYDGRLAFTHMADAARLMRLGDAVSGLALSLDEPRTAPTVVRQVAQDFGGGVYVSDWTRQHANFFRSIELTRSIIFVILLLVVAVAAFNIVSTLVMVVREKGPEIGILRTLGATSRSILAIFVFHGSIVGIGGTLIGAGAGILLSRNIGALAGALERTLSVRFLSPDVYFISDLPSRLQWLDVFQICSMAIFLAIFATVYPAWRGAAVDPAAALRHE
jgi:lipoprotein-releasing system permease protein